MLDEAINLRWFLLGSFPEGVAGGLALNVFIAVTAFAASFLAGHVLAIGRLCRLAWVRWPCTAYIELVRSVPLLIVLFWFYFSIPILFGITPSPVWTAFIALSAYAAGYQAEYIRAGIQAVSRGEREAAWSLGMTPARAWFHVVLPQAHRKMLPTYASYFTSMLKDTSVLYILGLVELMQAGLIVAERRPATMLQVYLTVGALFFVVCWSASQLGRWLERRLASPSPSGSRRALRPPAVPSPQVH